MPEYIVNVEVTTIYTTRVIASDEEQAEAKVMDMEYESMTEVSSTVEVTDIELVSEQQPESE